MAEALEFAYTLMPVFLIGRYGMRRFGQLIWMNNEL